MRSKAVKLPLSQLDRFQVFEEEPDAYYWCGHCERAYPVGTVRLLRELQMCPYDDCNGDTVMDARPWRDVRFGSMPEVPDWGVEYPLYGEA